MVVYSSFPVLTHLLCNYFLSYKLCSVFEIAAIFLCCFSQLSCAILLLHVCSFHMTNDCVRLSWGRRLFLSQTGVSVQINTLTGHTSSINKQTDRWPFFWSYRDNCVPVGCVKQQSSKNSICENLLKVLVFKKKKKSYNWLMDRWLFAKQN